MKQFGQQCLILLSLILMAGCTVRPVETELPVSHPANPQADSAPFTPPVNVFQSNVPPVQTPPASDSAMTPNHREKPDGKQMDHQMDPMKMKAKPSNAADMEKAGSEHKEHNQ